MIHDLLDKHKGEEAWLFTKGPSFDDFDMNQAGDLRLGVNETVNAIDSPIYCITCWSDHSKFNIPKGCSLLSGRDGEKSIMSRQQKSVETFKPKTLPLFFQYSTMSLAMSYLAWMGVAVVHVIGVDPELKYSEQFEWKGVELDEEAILIRKQTKNLMVEMAEKAGITMYDYGRN